MADRRILRWADISEGMGSIGRLSARSARVTLLGKREAALEAVWEVAIWESIRETTSAARFLVHTGRALPCSDTSPPDVMSVERWSKQVAPFSWADDRRTLRVLPK